jgi:2-isopropylmalate synthase
MDQFWYNQKVASKRRPKRIRIFDTTLRDGEQTPGVTLTAEEKLRIAEQLDKLGVDSIEAGFPIASKGEQEAIKRIAGAGLEAEVVGLARVLKEDIDAAIDCGVDCVHTFIGTSELHLKYKLKISQKECMEKAVEAIEYIKKHGLACEFSCEDATRTDLDFLKRMYRAAEGAGAERLNVPDTVGVMIPEAMKYLVTELRKELKGVISMHCHNDFGLAVANTLAGIEAGANQAHVTVNGLGERAGNASLEQTVASLHSFYGEGITNIDLGLLTDTSKLVQRYTNIVLTPNYPLVGDNAFSHEAGIHVHGVLSKAACYEPITPEIVGNKRRFVVGKHTGAHAVENVLTHLGYSVNKKQLGEIVTRVKELGDKKKRVSEEDLSALADEVLGRLPLYEQKLKLEDLVIVTGNHVPPTASVRLKIDGVEKIGSSIGVGPVDASAKAIKQIADIPNLNLKEYNLKAITGGTDALADVKITMEDDKRREYIGTSKHVDVIMASVEALIKCMNRALTKSEKK